MIIHSKKSFSNPRSPDEAPIELQRVLPLVLSFSPWPLCTAFSLSALLFFVVAYFNSWTGGLFFLFIWLCLLLLCLFRWFNDVIFEADSGLHSQLVQKGLRAGMLLFIISEIMFFVSFFWAFFHFALSPSVALFCVWPPLFIQTINPWGIPLLNTIILLSSGITLTYSHRALLVNRILDAWHGLYWTLIFGFYFTCCQIFEYVTCPFSINDSVYGSIFFMSTGFHGLHVLVGTIFLLVCFFRLEKFTSTRHLGFECAAYYWHFVDVVWLFLFVSVYWWGS